MNAKPRPSAPRPHDEDEIEILEVVGLDENPQAPPGDEIEVSFEDDGSVVSEPAAAGGRAPRTGETEARERYLRLYADFENLKKRVERERV